MYIHSPARMRMNMGRKPFHGYTTRIASRMTPTKMASFQMVLNQSYRLRST